MPIVVTCPGCPTKLSAPDSAGGKQIRCPKCGAVAPVPNLISSEVVEELPVVEAKVAPARPKPKPVQAEAADDDPPRKKASRRDEDDDEPPPRKKKRRYDDDDDDYDHDHPRRRRSGGGGGSGGKIAAIIVVGVLVLAGIGVGLYFLTGKGGVFAKKAPLPPGWKEYSPPDGGFRTAFPKEPQSRTVTAEAAGLGRMGAIGGMGGGPFAGINEQLQIDTISSHTTGQFAGQQDSDPLVTVAIVRFKGRVPSKIRDQMSQVTAMQRGNMETRKLRWLGEDAAELVMGGMVLRVVLTDRQMVLAQITGPNGARAKPEEEAAFFDNFELTR